MKHRLIGRIMAVLAGAFAVLSAQADCWQVRSGVGALDDWTAKNWADADGNPVETYPIGADADVVFPTLAGGAFGRARLCPKATFANFALNSVTGGPNWRIQFFNDGFALSVQKLTIPYPDGFTGYWTAYNKWGGGALVLPATAEHSPKASHVAVDSGFGIDVPTAGTEASVESLFGGGSLKKTGAGSLTIKKASGSESRLSALEGTVEIVGRAAADDVDSIVPGAALHLDASDDSTLTTDENVDGYTHVVEWRDADGGPIAAKLDSTTKTGKNNIPWCNTPYLSDAAVSPSGKRMIDFGGSVGGTLPSNCVLKLSASIGNVREVFWVGCKASGSGTYFGDSTQYFFSNADTDRLFDESTAQILNHPGDIRVNNESVPTKALWTTRYGSSLKDAFAASASVAEDYDGSEATISLIGSDRYIRARTGSLKIGEMLVYTNHLTASQRTRINDYLMNKWLKGHETEDFGVAHVGGSGSDTTVSVPAGNVARVGALTVHPGTTLVKDGAGTLSIGTLSPADATIQVAGGAVKIREPVAVTPGVAPNAYIHLDADAEGTIEKGCITGDPDVDPAIERVLRWKDCDGGAHYAAVPEQEYWDKFVKTDKVTKWYGKQFPSVVTVTIAGKEHRALDFGKYSNTASWMWLDEHGAILVGKSDAQARIYEGFAVLKSNYGSGFNFFGSSQQDFIRDGKTKCLVNPSYSAPAAAAARWTFDGVACDPTAENDAFADKASFHVVSFASDVQLTADLLAKDRLNFINGEGDWTIGEYVLYDRRLTPAERRATTAYLMKKWLGKDLPGAATPSFDYASDTAAVVDADAATTIPSVSGGNGDLVKRGAGAVTVGSAGGLTDLANIAVEGGELAVDLTAEEKAQLANVLSAAVFDYDAMNLDSFSNEVVTVGDVTRTNVISWADTKGRAGQIAYSAQIADDTSLIPADGSSNRTKPTTEHPTLQFVEMADGVLRPTVDFGAYGTGSANAGAGMHMRSINTSILEIHTVFADTDSGMLGEIVGARKDGKVEEGYPGYAFERARSGGGLLSGVAPSSANIINGYVAVDGEDFPPQGEALPSGFHLVSYAPLSAQWVGTLAMDRNKRCGGCRISEQIAFRRELSADERAVLQKHLMRKWLGTPRERAKSLTSISAAAGAALDLGDVCVGSGTLAGGGTITAAEVDDVSKLEISGAVDKLTVEGEVTFADDVTVELTGNVRRLAAGVHEIFAADAITNEDPIAFTVTGDELNPNRTYAAYRDGNSIFLKVEKKGMAILIR